MFHATEEKEALRYVLSVEVPILLVPCISADLHT